MKIGIFQDIHANLPALKKAIEVFKEQKFSSIYHVGDLIGLGPYPKEVFDLAHSVDEIEFIMGNHDHWFAFGLPPATAELMSKQFKSEEVNEHYKWTYEQVGEQSKNIVRKWAFTKEIKTAYGKSIIFQHYGYDKQTNWFKDFINKPTNKDLDELFKEVNADIIFYGHNHTASDIQGNSRYINLGSAGSYYKPEVRLGILDISQEKLDLEKFSVHYDDIDLLEEFERKQVPGRSIFKKAFINKAI